MVLKSPSPTYWAELKRTHLQNTHTHTHSHIHTPGARRRRKMRSELQQPPQMARCAPAEMYKCSEPYETHGLSERLPRFPPSLPHPPPLPPPPATRPGWERQESGISPLPPSPTPPHTPLSLPARPLPSSFPTHPPTHPLAGSRLSPAQSPAATRPPARPPAPSLAARRPLAAAKRKARRKGKSCSWDCEGLDWGGGLGELAARRGKALSFPLFGPRAARFCCNPDRERK